MAISWSFVFLELPVLPLPNYSLVSMLTDPVSGLTSLCMLHVVGWRNNKKFSSHGRLYFSSTTSFLLSFSGLSLSAVTELEAMSAISIQFTCLKANHL
jgi:hypothetical protein